MSNLQIVQETVQNLTNLPVTIRPKTVDGRPGGVIDFSRTNKDVYILGDIHGMVGNLRATLETDGLEDRLANNSAVLLLLGDIVHDDRVGHLTEMDSSLETLDELFKLINRFPRNVFSIRGNHDTFDRQVSKSGIRQAELFHIFLEQERGKEYADLVETFFDLMPLAFLGQQFFSFHAGPIRGGATREHLIEISRYGQDMFQLMWNRINQIGSVPNNKEYGPEDIAITKELLGYEDDAYLVVGHNPLLDRGGDDSIWFNVMGVKNYVITYNGLPDRCPVLIFRNGQKDHQLQYADLKIQKSRFVLGDY
ncbi:MAG: metallophosphoesterase [Spirochaetaceae bacterium]|nr:MAG: metallophosphoesterase [Spirochaetaceae bacterium]